jgi:hypothetical protein
VQCKGSCWGYRREEPTGDPRRSWVDIIRMDLLGEVVYMALVGKPEGKRPLGNLGVDG